jgi:Zn-dependent protease
VIGRGSLKLGTIKSIEINVNITWLVVFGLLIYWLRTGYIAENAPNMNSVTGWLVSALGALLLFGSVLTHELSHSLVGLRHGLPIRRITLFIFGGVAHMEREPRHPGVELRMALAGPAASIVIAGLFAFVRFVVLGSDPNSAAALITEYAAYANVVLACFNMVPGYPLDGGRVLRALLWLKSKDFVRSTIVAAAVGRVFGLVLIFAGMMFSVALDAPGFLWLAFIGTFLERLAYMSAYRARMMKLRPPDEAYGPQTVSATPFPRYYVDRSGWHGVPDRSVSRPEADDEKQGGGGQAGEPRD